MFGGLDRNPLVQHFLDRYGVGDEERAVQQFFLDRDLSLLRLLPGLETFPSLAGFAGYAIAGNMSDNVVIVQQQTISVTGTVIDASGEPFTVPASTMFTPTNGSPLASITVPVTLIVCCCTITTLSLIFPAIVRIQTQKSTTAAVTRNQSGRCVSA